jgi:hypothetical protein
MSYIVKKNEPLVNLKLTNAGRVALSSGRLMFTNFGLGDGEMDYSSDTPSLVNVLRPVDNQHDIQYPIPSEGTQYKLPISNITSVPTEIYASAKERGFFEYTGTTVNIDTTLWSTGVVTGTTTGGTTIDLTFNSDSISNSFDTSIKTGDLLLLKFKTSDYISNYPQGLGKEITPDPIPILMYSIVTVNGITDFLLSNYTTGVTLTIVVDRDLPAFGTSTVEAVVYPGPDTIKTYYDNETPIAYWSDGLLNFTTNCTLANDDVPVWNMNIISIEEVIGLDNTFYKGKYTAKSRDFWGTAINYDYFLTNLLDRVGVIHYTNNSVSNYYGEGFYRDTFKLKIPHIMWHKKQFGGAGLADEIGYTFICDATANYMGINNSIKYYNLVDQETTPTIVGKVFPDQKIAIIENPELLAVLSYKSNRNWTLPKPKLTLIEPGTCNGTSYVGVLQENEVLHVTYRFLDSNGINALHCEDYTSIENLGTTPKDVVFQFTKDPNDATYSEVSYVRDYATFDGTGFRTNGIWLVWQKTALNVKPEPSGWHYFSINNFIATSGCAGSVPVDSDFTAANINNLRVNIDFDLIDASSTTNYDISSFISLPIILLILVLVMNYFS